MQFEIDGRPYDVPMLSSFDLDEDRLFYQATGMHTEDAWLGLETGTVTSRDLFDNEGFLAVMAQIAYRREHPEITDDLIVRLVGKQKRVDMIASLARSIADDEEDAEPGKDEGTTSVPNESSKSSSEERTTTSEPRPSPDSTRSESASVPPVVARGTTGTPGSDTSPESAPIRLAS